MTKNEVRENNYYYVTADMTKQNKIGRIKPGTSRQKSASARTNVVKRNEKGMKVIGYLKIDSITKSRLEDIEGRIKADLNDIGFTHFGNDHFEFKFNRTGKRKTQYELVAAAILYRAARLFESYHYKCDFVWLG